MGRFKKMQTCDWLNIELPVIGCGIWITQKLLIKSKKMYLPDNDGPVGLDVFSFMGVLRFFCLQQEGFGILLLPVGSPAATYKSVFFAFRVSKRN